MPSNSAAKRRRPLVRGRLLGRTPHGALTPGLHRPRRGVGLIGRRQLSQQVHASSLGLGAGRQQVEADCADASRLLVGGVAGVRRQRLAAKVGGAVAHAWVALPGERMNERVDRGVGLRPLDLGDQPRPRCGIVDLAEQSDRVVAGRLPHGGILERGHEWQKRGAEIGFGSAGDVGGPAREPVGVVAKRWIRQRRSGRRDHATIAQRRQTGHAAGGVGELIGPRQRQQRRARRVAERRERRSRLSGRAIDSGAQHLAGGRRRLRGDEGDDESGEHGRIIAHFRAGAPTAAALRHDHLHLVARRGGEASDHEAHVVGARRRGHRERRRCRARP